MQRARHRRSAITTLPEDIEELAANGRAIDLVSLLLESSPIYVGRRTEEVDRLRTIVLGAFERHGLPGEALSFVLEELESGNNPQTVAAAARALRNSKQPPAEASDFLVRAIDRFAHGDDVIENSDLNGEAPTTLLTELLRTLTRLGPNTSAGALAALQSVAERNIHAISGPVRAELERALKTLAADRPKVDCCCSAEIAALDDPSIGKERSSPPTGVLLQDQDGEQETFGSLFGGRPSVIAFFYTRCMNPQKCSVTITKLGRLQKTIAASELRDRVNVAAITYDPKYDLPSRLRSYGLDRGMTFGRYSRLLRTPHNTETLHGYFDLQVGFGPVTVNRHRLELFVLDRACRIAAAYTRIQWDEKKIFDSLSRLQIS
jgi:protein SCO1/2